MKIDTYRNLNDECISVRSREPEDYGTVVHHAECITVEDVEFVVQESGQKKCRESERKNVHALVRGEWNDSRRVIAGIEITYNPFEYDHFVEESSGRAVEAADVALVTKRGVFANDVTFL